ncbi:hypothetical protein PENTCL1PPCAC_23215, partial [Pristionchus entomophagus]
PSLLSTSLAMWWVVVAALLHSVEGAVSPPQYLNVTSARSSSIHPLHIKNPLTLWCSADGLKSAKFVHLSKEKKIHPAKITGNNATITIDSPTVLYAGDYRCEMEAKGGMKTETTSVYVRPVVHTELVEKVDEKEGENFIVDMTAIVLTEGGSFNITCPAFSHPLPKIKWTKNGNILTLSSRISLSGDRLTITGVDFSDEGVYSCEAVNEFTVATKTMRPMLKVSRIVTVKSQYAWVWPLAVIIATLLILILVIWFCEIRKKNREKRAATYLAED